MPNEIKVGDTTIKVREESGKVTVNVTTEGADICVNGSCIWSRYDKPEYQKIPPALRSFVEEHQSYLNDDGDQITADLDIPDSAGVTATFYFPKNARKMFTARMDFTTTMKELEFDYIRNKADIDEATADSLVEEMKAALNNIRQEIESAGYKFIHSHDVGDKYWGYWDIVFSLKQWDEARFVSIWKRMIAFMKRVKEVA